MYFLSGCFLGLNLGGVLQSSLQERLADCGDGKDRAFVTPSMVAAPALHHRLILLLEAFLVTIYAKSIFLIAFSFFFVQCTSDRHIQKYSI